MPRASSSGPFQAPSPIPPQLSPAARRLLDALADAGARVGLDPFDAGRVVARASRAGVTLTVASAALAEAETLVAAGLCQWIEENGAPRLTRACGPAARGPFEASRPALSPEGSGARTRLVDAAESPLAWLARRRGTSGEAFLGAAAFAAGERLRRDLELARMLPRVTQSWAAPTGGSGAPGEATQVAVDAGRRARRALGAVGGEMAGLLLDVCGFLKGLETVEAERGWPRRSGKIVLRIALERLAAHYGLGEEARGKATSPSRVWRESAQPVQV